MKEVQIGGTRVTVGLLWEALEDLPPRQARRNILSRHKGVRFGLYVGEGRLRTVGLALDAKRLPSAPSAAALLAFANQEREANRSITGPASQSVDDGNWILVEQLADDEFWIIAINEGLPLPGTDVVGTRKDVVEILDDVLASSPHWLVHSADEEIRVYANAHVPVDDAGFGTLVAGIRTSRAELKQIAGIPRVMMLTVLLLATVVSIWFFYSYWMKKQQEAAAAAAAAAEAAKRAAAEAQARSEYSQTVRKVLLAALSDGERAVDRALSTPAPGRLIQGWTSLAQSVSLAQAGWSLGGLDCGTQAAEVGLTPQCSIAVTRGETGVDRLLLWAHPDAAMNGDSATFVYTAPAVPARAPVWENLRSANSFSMDLISDLQLLHGTGVEYSQSASKEVVQAVSVPPPPAIIRKPGAPQNIVVAPIKMGVATGKLSLSGTGLWQLDGLESLLNKAAVSVQEVKIDPKNASWTLDGTYLIRTLPQPVLPVVILPDGNVIKVGLPESFLKAHPPQLSGVESPPEQAEPIKTPAPLPPAAPEPAAPPQATGAPH